MASVIERTYAEGLFDLALEKDLVNKINGEFYDLHILFEENKELKMVLANPRISKQGKCLMMENILKGCNPYFINFVKLLVKNNRINLLVGIYNYYSQLYLKINNIKIIEIVSAKELSSKQVTDIQELFEEKLNQEVQVKLSVDQRLIGGLKIKIDDTLIDNSLSSRIENLKKEVIGN